MKLFKKIALVVFCLFIVTACKSDKEDKLAKLTPEQLYNSGMIHLKKQEYKEAIRHFERIQDFSSS